MFRKGKVFIGDGKTKKNVSKMKVETLKHPKNKMKK